MSEFVPEANVPAYHLGLIENRAAHALSKRRQAARLLLGQPVGDPFRADDLVLADLEETVDDWRFLIPTEADERQALASALREHHQFSGEDAPGMAAALNSDGWIMSAAHGQLPEGEGDDDGERASPSTIASAMHALPKQNSPAKIADRALHSPPNQDNQAPPVETADRALHSKPDQDPQPEPPDPLHDVMRELTWRYFYRGDTLFSEGDAADHLFVLVDGAALSTSTNGALDAYEEQLPRQLTPHFGETHGQAIAAGTVLGHTSLLTGRPYRRTIRAARDSDVCCLSRDAFLRLTQRHPDIMMRVAAQMASKRFGQSSQRLDPLRPQPPRSISAVVVPTSAEVGDRSATEFALALVAELSRHGSVGYITPQSVAEVARERAGQGVDLEAFVDDYGFVDWLQAQADHHDALVFEADASLPGWTRRCVEQADRLLIVGRAGASPKISAAEQLIDNMPHAELLPPRELVLLHARKPEAFANIDYSTTPWLAARNLRRHHHVALATGEGIDRVSRFLRGRAVGLALGGGGMRAAAGYGIIRVLQEMNVPIDVVGGTSSGAISAAQFAMGLDSEAIIRNTRDKLMQREVLVDPTLPLTSMMRAKRLVQVYRDIFGDVRLEDLWRTGFTISANLSQAEMVIFRDGLVRDAVRASTSLAGIHPPALNEQGDMLIDGGIFNNTPADVVRAMVDAGPVIAVDLGFTQRDSEFHYGEWLSGFRVLAGRLLPFVDKIQAPSIVSIMMRANALYSINATHIQVAHADLLLQPPVAAVGLFDFEVFDEVVEKGYAHGKPRLEEWVANGGLAEVRP